MQNLYEISEKVAILYLIRTKIPGTKLQSTNKSSGSGVQWFHVCSKIVNRIFIDIKTCYSMNRWLGS